MSRVSIELETPSIRTLTLLTGDSETVQPGGNGTEHFQKALTLHEIESTHSTPPISKWKASIIIVTVSSMTFMQSCLSGTMTVGLPNIATDLQLGDNLLLWPASVYSLTCGCCLLLLGSIGDVVGSRLMYISGCALLTAFTLASGFSQTGIQLIIFRAISGLAVAFCLPNAMSIITSSFPRGTRQNIAFACQGAAQPMGFCVGIVVGGLLVDSIGWRYIFWLVPIINFIVVVLAVLYLPKDMGKEASLIVRHLKHDIDWLGVGIASASMAILSYVLATVTGGLSKLRDPVNIALLVTALVLMPAFVFWMSLQEKHQRPAVIPNSLWNSIFSAICLTVFASLAVFFGTQYFATLFFQKIQQLSTMQTAIRFLPAVISGAVTNAVAGYLVDKVSANHIVLATTLLTSLSPMLFALADRDSVYWGLPFWSLALAPIASDTLFTISNLVISQAFPPKSHGLAGGVFNTLGQIGSSVGLAVGSVVASAVTAGHTRPENADLSSLLSGYKATFWTCCAVQAAMLPVAAWGMRRIGKVGLKRD